MMIRTTPSIERNIVRLKHGGASEHEIDRYLSAKGIHGKIAHVWRRPLAASGTATAAELADLQARFGLEA